MPTEQSEPPVPGQSAEQSPELDRLGRRRHPGQFQKGRSGNPSGKPKAEEPEEEWEEGDGLSIAQKMRKVADQPRSRDRGSFEKSLRKPFDDDLDRYLARMAGLDRAEAGKAGVTFSDALTAVRRGVGANGVFPQARVDTALQQLPGHVQELLLTALAPAP